MLLPVEIVSYMRCFVKRQTCYCYLVVDCKKCNKTSNYIGYVADKCDCSIYYQCHLANGEWTATLMSCPRCQHWDSAMLTCVVSQDTTCETVTTSGMFTWRYHLKVEFIGLTTQVTAFQRTVPWLNFHYRSYYR